VVRGDQVVRNVAPGDLGDYYSWAVRDGRNLILTIQDNFYYLDGDKAVLPASRIPPCPGIGVGARPLISKDGRRVTTFVGTTVYVRDLNDFAKLNTVYGTYFKDRPPARATVQVQRLPKDAAVEISAIAMP